MFGISAKHLAGFSVFALASMYKFLMVPVEVPLGVIIALAILPLEQITKFITGWMEYLKPQNPN